MHQEQHTDKNGIYTAKAAIKFECNLYGKAMASDLGLYCHRRQVHSNGNYQCDIFGKIFRNMKVIYNHMKIHFNVPCPTCHRLITKRSLEEHFKRHLSTPPLVEKVPCRCSVHKMDI